MVYVTGDKHGSYEQIGQFCQDHHTTIDDVMIVLGDNGVNYYGHKKDKRLKKKLAALPITFIMLRGNHDARPDPKYYRVAYEISQSYAGVFYIEDEYPNILFTAEYGLYIINHKRCYVICGAYSVDKYYRLQMYDQGYHQYRWFYDEQLTKEDMEYAEDSIKNTQPVDYILSHTCPLKYTPADTFLPFIDQQSVDHTMEEWLDGIESSVEYGKWLCGHWHTDRTIDRMRFMYHDIISLQ